MGFEPETTRSLQQPRASNAKYVWHKELIKIYFSNRTYFNVSLTTKCALLWLFSFTAPHFLTDKLFPDMNDNQFAQSKFTKLELGP